MNPEGFQELVDEIRSTSRQGWLIRLLGVTAALAALVCTEQAAGGFSDWVLYAVVGGTVVTVVRPDGHAALFVIGILCARYLASVDDVRTPGAIGIGLCLLVFHAAMALAATGPPAVVFPPEILLTWLRRTAAVSSAPPVVWLLAISLDRLDARGNALLTAVAIAGVAGSALVLRKRSVSG